MTDGTRRLAGTALLCLGLLCLLGLGVLLLVRPEWEWWLRGSLATVLRWSGAGLLLAGFGLRATAERGLTTPSRSDDGMPSPSPTRGGGLGAWSPAGPSYGRSRPRG